jgi:release factor glutamine methyltransferase
VLSVSLSLEPRVKTWQRLLALGWLTLKRPFLLARVRRVVLESIDGIPLVVLPDVLNPVVFRSGTFLAKTIEESELADPMQFGPTPRALDMGTGSGIAALVAARRGYDVTAVDINPEAVRCTRVNALLNKVEHRVDVRHGDLFEPVPGLRFQLVFFNPPFHRGRPKDLFDLAWRSVDTMERFAADLPQALAPGGVALIVLSTDGQPSVMLSALKQHRFDVQPVAQKNYGNEVMTVFAARLPGQEGSQ